MRMLLRSILLLLLLFLLTSLSAYYFWYKPKFKYAEHSSAPSINRSSETFARLALKASSIKEYISDHNYNPSICFLIDMKIASGKERFFVYDLDKDSILISGLVAHGSCDNGFQADPVFSNTVNSGCSSIGKFKIGKSYNGRFGLAYKLYGLDSSNSNAYDRTIVLHSYKCVPGQETYPLPICNSRGCPMVAPGFLEKLKAYLDNSEKPVLMWIY